jgi:hypothetical protein
MQNTTLNSLTVRLHHPNCCYFVVGNECPLSYFSLFHSSGFALASQRSDLIDSVSPSHIAKELWVKFQRYAQDVAMPIAERLEKWPALGGETAESGKILGMP